MTFIAINSGFFQELILSDLCLAMNLQWINKKHWKKLEQTFKNFVWFDRCLERGYNTYVKYGVEWLSDSSGYPFSSLFNKMKLLRLLNIS